MSRKPADPAGVAFADEDLGEGIRVAGPDGRTRRYDWSDTLFWNVYYVKGAFLDADKAFEVINGMRTLELRMLQKCIGTQVLADCVTIDERPHIPKGLASAPFDDEGVPTFAKTMIDKGVVKDYFHDTCTAGREGRAGGQGLLELDGPGRRRSAPAELAAAAAQNC